MNKYQTQGQVTPEMIQQSRFEAIQGLVEQGITNTEQLLDYLNYDEQGNEIGDFTEEEVIEYLDSMGIDTLGESTDRPAATEEEEQEQPEEEEEEESSADYNSGYNPYQEFEEDEEAMEEEEEEDEENEYTSPAYQARYGMSVPKFNDGGTYWNTGLIYPQAKTGMEVYSYFQNMPKPKGSKVKEGISAQTTNEYVKRMKDGFRESMLPLVQAGMMDQFMVNNFGAPSMFDSPYINKKYGGDIDLDQYQNLGQRIGDKVRGLFWNMAGTRPTDDILGDPSRNVKITKKKGPLGLFTREKTIEWGPGTIPTLTETPANQAKQPATQPNQDGEKKEGFFKRLFGKKDAPAQQPFQPRFLDQVMMSDTWRPQNQGFMQAQMPGGRNALAMRTNNPFDQYNPYSNANQGLGFQPMNMVDYIRQNPLNQNYRPKTQYEANLQMYRNLQPLIPGGFKKGGTYNLPRMQVNNPTFAFNADEAYKNQLANVDNDPEYIDGVRPPAEPDINVIDPKALGEPDFPDQGGKFTMTRKQLDVGNFYKNMNKATIFKQMSDMARQQQDDNLGVNSNTVMGVLPNSISDYGDSLVNTPGMGAAFRANDYTAGTFSQGVGMREAYPLMWNQPNRVQTGGSAFVDYNVGDEDYWTDEQIQEFISLGGQVDILED